MKLTLLHEERPYEFKWWSGTIENYEACFRYRVEDQPKETSGGDINVAVGWRAAFGANRRRVLVFRGRGNVLVELVGTDDCDVSRNVAWLIKVPGSNRNAANIKDVPPEFLEFDVDRFNEWVTGFATRTGYAIRIHEDDHPGMVKLALYRELHKAQKASHAPETAGTAADDAVAERDVIPPLADGQRVSKTLLRREHRAVPERRSKRLIVIACGKRKVWDEDPNHDECSAKDAYRGQFFTVNRKYAERFAPNDWMILSARFGFLHPDTPITDYNATFNEKTDEVISPDQLRVTAIHLGVHEYDKIEVLGGRAYVEQARSSLQGYPVRVLAPYSDCGGIGEMMGKATKAIRAGVPM